MAATEVGVHHPDGEDAFAPHTDMRLLAESLTPLIRGQFTNTADRDLAIPSPTDGMVCTTGTGASLRFWACQNGEWADLLAVIGRDTEWVNITSAISAGDGWTVGSLHARRVGDLVSFRIRDLAVAAGTFTIPTSGNIANQTAFRDIPEQFRPGVTSPLVSYSEAVTFLVTPGGTFEVAAVPANATQTGSVPNAATSWHGGGTFLV